MGTLEIVLLGVVQGLTEFLPVSSSGHLVVGAELFEAFSRTSNRALIEVSIVLHLGTLLAVLIYYRRRVWRLLGQDRRVIPLLAVGTLPAVAIGLPIRIFAAEQVLESPLLAGLMFPITAIGLIWGSRLEPGEVDYTHLGYRQAFVIGLVQAAAILPGISRSGATIVAGLAVGMRRDSAATFAFLLAIPVMAGAGVLEALQMVKTSGSTNPPAALALGAAVSCVVGLAALWWLIRLVQRGKLAYFAFWLIPLGVAVTVWQLSL